MRKKFNWQSFISIGLLISFLVMLISGLVLYVAPEGSLSRWIGWDILNLTKKQWEHQHAIFSLVFILFSIFHIFRINWGLLLSYFALENKKFTNIKEFIAAIVICIILFTGTVFNLSPFKNIIDFGSKIADKQKLEVVERPNIPDIDKLLLEEFSEKVFNISMSEFKIILERNNLKVMNENSSVNEFCSKNNLSPQELYLLVKKSISK